MFSMSSTTYSLYYTLCGEAPETKKVARQCIKGTFDSIYLQDAQICCAEKEACLKVQFMVSVLYQTRLIQKSETEASRLLMCYHIK